MKTLCGQGAFPTTLYFSVLIFPFSSDIPSSNKHPSSWHLHYKANLAKLHLPLLSPYCMSSRRQLGLVPLQIPWTEIIFTCLSATLKQHHIMDFSPPSHQIFSSVFFRYLPGTWASHVLEGCRSSSSCDAIATWMIIWTSIIITCQTLEWVFWPHLIWQQPYEANVAAPIL